MDKSDGNLLQQNTELGFNFLLNVQTNFVQFDFICGEGIQWWQPYSIFNSTN